LTGCVYGLLVRAKLGRFPDLVFLAETVSIQLAAPYLACKRLEEAFGDLPVSELLPRRIRRRRWGRLLFENQVYSLGFVGVAGIGLTIYIPSISNISRLQVILLHLVLIAYIFVGASIGAFFWRLTRRQFFAVELAYMGWSVLTGGVFVLAPLERYVKNLEPIIPPFLHLNPLIAVCHLLRMDIFRTPYLYELTPVASYLYVYPPVVIVCGWQLLIGMLFFTLSLHRV
jgi:hypothetical protein